MTEEVKENEVTDTENVTETEKPKTRRRRRKTVEEHTVSSAENTTDIKQVSVCTDKPAQIKANNTSVQSSNTQVQGTEVHNTDAPMSKSVKGTYTVYEAPYDGSYRKVLTGVFTPVCMLNGFVQVEYMKYGMGLVKGYVLPKNIK